MAQTGRNLPPPQSPFVDAPSRNLSDDGYQFLLGLLAQAANAPVSVATALTAQGGSQATALQLEAQWNEIVAVTFSGNGVLLSAFQAGQSQAVFTKGVAVNVYPPPGMAINNLPVNTPFALAANDQRTFSFLSAVQIRS